MIPDRIEAATFAVAAAMTNGEVTLKGARADHLHAVLDKLNEAGKTIILVTHEDEVAHRAKRIIRLRDGSVQSDERLTK